MPRTVVILILAVCWLTPIPSADAAPAPATGTALYWDWPVASPHSVIRPFIAPATAYSAGHRGMDIAAPDGVLRAPTDGVIHFAGVVVDRAVLSIRHPGALITSYEPVTTTLAAGDEVRRGDVIGTVGAGHCASVCLHFGVRLDGEYISPLVYLGGMERSVLLPTRQG